MHCYNCIAAGGGVGQSVHAYVEEFFAKSWLFCKVLGALSSCSHLKVVIQQTHLPDVLNHLSKESYCLDKSERRAIQQRLLALQMVINEEV